MDKRRRERFYGSLRRLDILSQPGHGKRACEALERSKCHGTRALRESH